jgi:hypothetical protein
VKREGKRVLVYFDARDGDNLVVVRIENLQDLPRGYSCAYEVDDEEVMRWEAIEALFSLAQAEMARAGETDPQDTHPAPALRVVK